MYRKELKYLINNVQVQEIREKVKKVCHIDENSNNGGTYQVTSLYFDDFCDSALQHNLIGFQNRKKFRIRIYNKSDGYIKLERKVKKNDGCKKDSAIITKEEYRKILNRDFEFIKKYNSKIMRDFYLTSQIRYIKPKVIIDYNREAYVCSLGRARITLDRYLKKASNISDLFNDKISYQGVLGRFNIILEIKFTGFLPEHIHNIIKNKNIQRQAISKYTICRTQTV